MKAEQRDSVYNRLLQCSAFRGWKGRKGRKAVHVCCGRRPEFLVPVCAEVKETVRPGKAPTRALAAFALDRAVLAVHSVRDTVLVVELNAKDAPDFRVSVPVPFTMLDYSAIDKETHPNRRGLIRSRSSPTSVGN